MYIIRMKQKIELWSKSEHKTLEKMCKEHLEDGWFIHQIVPKRTFQGDELIAAYIIFNKND